MGSRVAPRVRREPSRRGCRTAPKVGALAPGVAGARAGWRRQAMPEGQTAWVRMAAHEVKLPAMPSYSVRSRTAEDQGAAAGKTDAKAEVFPPTREATPCSQMSPADRTYAPKPVPPSR